MIITDGIHLTSTTSEDELHQFAQGMGLKRAWFQNRNAATQHPHYDLTTCKAKARALAAGAKMVSSYNIIYDSYWTNRTKAERATMIERGRLDNIFGETHKMTNDTTDNDDDLTLRHPLTRDIEYPHMALPPNRTIYVKGIECAVVEAKVSKRLVYQVIWGNVKYTVTKGDKQKEPTLDDLRVIARKIQTAIDENGGAEAAKLAVWNMGKPR